MRNLNCSKPALRERTGGSTGTTVGGRRGLRVTSGGTTASLAAFTPLRPEQCDASSAPGGATERPLAAADMPSVGSLRSDSGGSGDHGGAAAVGVRLASMLWPALRVVAYEGVPAAAAPDIARMVSDDSIRDCTCACMPLMSACFCF